MGSSFSTTEATVEVPVTTVDQLLAGTPVLQAVLAEAGSGHNQLGIRDIPFVQERCSSAARRASVVWRFAHHSCGAGRPRF